MTLTTQKKLAQHICRLLKVTDITFPIGRTSKGNFGIVFNENGDYEMMLDSVPLSTKNVLTDENNIELKRMVEKYWFDIELKNTFWPENKELKEAMDEEDARTVLINDSLNKTASKKKSVSHAKKHGKKTNS